MSSAVNNCSSSYIPQLSLLYFNSEDQPTKRNSPQNAKEKKSTSVLSQGYLTTELRRTQTLYLKDALNVSIPKEIFPKWERYSRGIPLLTNLLRTTESLTQRFTFFLDEKNFVFYHIKNEQTIIKFGSFIKKGANKTAWKVVQFRPIPKTYCLLKCQYSNSSKLTAEFLATKKLNHPNIIKCRKPVRSSSSWGRIDSTKISLEPAIGYKTELYSDGTAERLTRFLPKNNSEVLERVKIIYDISKALLHIHSFKQGSVPLHLAHTDIKPSNIFLKIDQKEISGILGDINPQSEGRKSIYVTPNYIPPELGKNLILTSQGIIKNGFPLASQAGDIWALGLSLYQLVYGKESPRLEPTKQDPTSYQLNYTKFLKDIHSKMAQQPPDSIYRKVNLLITIMINPCSSLRITAKALEPIMHKFLIENNC